MFSKACETYVGLDRALDHPSLDAEAEVAVV